jgi:hypothetical protein
MAPCGRREAIGRQAMTLLLRKQNAQDRIEGREPIGWSDHDYAVVDETRIGRIYREHLPAGDKWCRFIEVTRAPLPNSGTADTLDDAKAAIGAAYERCRQMRYPNPSEPP